MDKNLLYNQQKKLLNYWRAAIKNEHILGIKINYDQYNNYFLAKNIFYNKDLFKQETQRLFAKYKQSLIKIKNTISNLQHDSLKNPLEEQKETLILPLLISPFIYKRTHEQGDYKSYQKTNYLHPIWIYAYLDENGNLFSEYPCHLPPWIAREHLNPVYIQADSTVIGEISDYDKFLDENNINNIHNSNISDISIEDKNVTNIIWEDLYNYAKKMLKKVSPNFANCLLENGYCKDELEVILVVPANNNKNKQYSATILKLLDSLAMSDQQFCQPFSNYLTLIQSPAKNVLSMAEQLEHFAIKHLGQMRNDFPLAKSQRISLHHLFACQEENGKILAINGPPGTGKTTLLSSIIASLFVQAAIKNELPPIIVVSSTNNRAIQNVIDSLKNQNIQDKNSNLTPKDLLEQRWIKGVTNFGLYLTNTPNVFYQYYSCKNQSGTLQEIENINFKQTKDHYLGNFNSYFNLNIFSLEQALDILHDKIIALEKSLKSALNIASKYNKIPKKYRSLNNAYLNTKIQHFKNRLEKLNLDIDKLNLSISTWEIIINQTKWHKLLSFLFPFLKKNLENILTKKIKNFVLNNKISIKPKQELITYHLEQQKKYYNSQTKKLIILITNYEKYLSILLSITSEWDQWQENQKIKNLDLETLLDFNSTENKKPENVLFFLDTIIRYRLFQYATHYWEGKWIIKNIEKIKNNERNQSDKNSRLNNFKHMAMLAPCFITTMQSGPGFFTFKMTNDQSEEFIIGGIDLLIIDEASQVNPGYGAAMMALCKTALVVGDNLQLPPIANLPGSADIGNMKYYDLINNNQEYYDISKYGANISECSKNGTGSVMKLAQNASFFNDPNINDLLKEKGLSLTEHRRCVPEIISYCNEFFYHNTMTYNREPNKDRSLPPIGYAHISGSQKTVGSSKINNTEAMSIVKWISEQKNVFYKLYPGKNLDQIFGIITPFNSQANLIKSLAKEEGLNFKENNVGTIHTFQGGEFPVIIFSPVYSYQPFQQGQKLFFDTARNMLNVAVSRAKDHFFVFGDMEIFLPTSTNLPSGFLANYLFAKPENEIINAKTFHAFYKNNANIIIKHINSLEEHRAILKKAFIIAKQKVFLISPWITYNAIIADNLGSLIKNSVSRKIEVVIYTDINKINYNNNGANQWFKNIKILEQAGATMILVKNIHAKTLFVDHNIFIEGSFNWLSASRELPGYEASICCEGQNLKFLINNFIKRFKDRPSFVTDDGKNFKPSAKKNELITIH